MGKVRALQDAKFIWYSNAPPEIFLDCVPNHEYDPYQLDKNTKWCHTLWDDIINDDTEILKMLRKRTAALAVQAKRLLIIDNLHNRASDLTVAIQAIN